MFFENGIACEDRRHVRQNTRHERIGFDFYCKYCFKENNPWEFDWNDMRVECNCETAQLELNTNEILDKKSNENEKYFNKLKYDRELKNLKNIYEIK